MCQYTMYRDQIELNAQLQDMIKQEPEKGGPDNHPKEQYLGAARGIQWPEIYFSLYCPYS